MASLVNFEASDVNASHERIFGQLGFTPPTMLLELSQPCEQLIRFCYWLGQEEPCAEVFQTTRTHVGFCCSFNADAAMYVNKTNSPYRSQTPNIRVSGSGRHVGLSVLVDIEPQHYLAPTKSFFGAEVFIHSPDDLPGDSDFEDILQPGWDVDFGVTPIPIDSSDTLKRVPLKQRKCFMEGEGKLQSNNLFSLNYCMAECRLRTIIKLCNCVPFYYVGYNVSEAAHVPVCTLQNTNCLRLYRKFFYSLKPPKNIAEGRRLSFELGMDCDCMPSCTFLNYNVQSISSKRKSGPFTSSYFGGRNVSSYATLHVHFKDLYCVKYRREAFMTWDSLLASFGGIFGLCMGGSVLSIVELVYYFLIKPFTFYKQGEDQRSSADQRVRPLSTPSSSDGNGPFRKRKSSLMFRPQRYPVRYFERRNVICRTRMSGKNGRKKMSAERQITSSYELETRDENGVIILY
ncbi:pickpocket protein 28-like [Uranotaenia lowii]|uniref:pickpocket protein 28-like n=1 Tax=Uranotaenia lowii TaxID=190385 RepID=UPI00247A3426|nr:pickpocket protein 28-like [Uranotaenia lowii]